MKTLSRSLLDPTLLSQLPPLALKALRVVEGALTGLHQSPHHGQSIEFTEHKEYSIGDEIRHIDWKLYAKSDRYYVKQFEDETNLSAYLLLDLSESMAYPLPHQADRQNKFTYSAILALSIAYLLFRQRDAVGLFTFNERLQDVLPPKSRPSYLLPISQLLETKSPEGQTSFIPVLRELAELMRRRSLLILFSDFLTDPNELTLLLKQFVFQGHDVVLFHVMDHDELDFPFKERLAFEGMEDKRQKLQIDALDIRSYYLKELQRYLHYMKAATTEAGIEYWLVDTRQSIEETLRRFLVHRHHQRRPRR